METKLNSLDSLKQAFEFQILATYLFYTRLFQILVKEIHMFIILLSGFEHFNAMVVLLKFICKYMLFLFVRESLCNLF